MCNNLPIDDKEIQKALYVKMGEESVKRMIKRKIIKPPETTTGSDFSNQKKIAEK
jgi:hypothetical protein